MRRHNGDVFQCSFCDSTQTCRWQLQKHLESKHFFFSHEPNQSEDLAQEEDKKINPLNAS